MSKLDELWQERITKRCPVQYLAGSTPWRNLSLKVNSAVLIPRPETEYIIDLALLAIQESPRAHLNLGHWVDLGTGSGAIALGLAQVLSSTTVHGVDCSNKALKIAQENAQEWGFSNKIKFYQGSWWSPLTELKGKVSGMVSNPPYIPTNAIAELETEVRQHEPHLALDGGEEGLEHISHLIKTAPDYLVSGGVWLIEMMAGQGEKVREMLEKEGSYQQIKIFQDLAGIERFARAYRR